MIQTSKIADGLSKLWSREVMERKFLKKIGVRRTCERNLKIINFSQFQLLLSFLTFFISLTKILVSLAFYASHLKKCFFLNFTQWISYS